MPNSYYAKRLYAKRHYAIWHYAKRGRPVAIDTVGSGKLRVTLSDRKQANGIVACEHFTREYQTYLPSHRVEIAGVVTEGSMTCEELMQGCGRFKTLLSHLSPFWNASNCIPYPWWEKRRSI